MKDKCPFCGAEAVTTVEWKDGISHDFACGTEQTPGGFYRNNECYEAELITLKTRNEALEKWGREVVKNKIRGDDAIFPDCFCCIICGGSGDSPIGVNHRDGCYIAPARTLGLVEE